MQRLRWLAALALIAAACGDAATVTTLAGPPATEPPRTQPASTSAEATTISPAAATTTSPPSTPAVSTTAIESSLLIEGDDAFVAHTERALALLEARAPNDYATVLAAIDTILSVPSGSGMDVFTKTFRVGDQTAYAPGYGEQAQVDWFAGTIVHDACHSVLYQEGAEYSGRDAELACLQKQLAALEQIESEGVFQPYVQGLIEGVDDPANSYWTDPNRHW